MDPSTLGALCAIGSSFVWALAPLISLPALREVGTLTFASVRMAIGGAILLVGALVFGSFANVSGHAVVLLMLSGLIGVVIGDITLYGSQNVIGVRMAGLLYSANSAMTVLIGFVWLHEVMPLPHVVACGLIVIGLVIAVMFRNPNAPLVDKVTGSLAIGIALGLISALAQAIGAVIAKPAMETGIDPIVASAIRVNTAAGAQFFISMLRGGLGLYRLPPGPMRRVTISAFLSLGLGIPMLMIAIRSIPVGAAAVLSSLAPVFVLPLIHLVWKEKVSGWCWFGALLCVAGSAWILLT